MIRWIKHRRLKGQRKLLYQNSAAGEGNLAGLFYNDPEVLLLISMLVSENSRAALMVDVEELLPLAVTERLLDINKLFRRMYDTTSLSRIKTFDDAHKPVLGWSEYLRN